MATLKIRKVGNSLGATFPKELLDKLNLKDGDTLTIVETDRGFELTPYDPEFEAAMEAYRRVSSKYRNALRELAK